MIAPFVADKLNDQFSLRPRLNLTGRLDWLKIIFPLLFMASNKIWQAYKGLDTAKGMLYNLSRSVGAGRW